MTVVGAVALALVAMIAGFNLLLQHNLSRNADQLLRARAGAELALVRVHNGKVTVGETADDAAVDSKSWVFSGGRTLEAPQAGASLASTASALAARAPAAEELPENDTRLYAAPITSHGRRLGAVVASISLAPYEETERTALVASLALGGLLSAGRRAGRPLVARRLAAAGRADDTPGGRLERAGSRPPLRARMSPTTR